jgi:transcriptional regulator NrdR family protein
MKCKDCGKKFVKVVTRPQRDGSRLSQWRCKGCSTKMVTVERILAIQRASVKRPDMESVC